MTEILRAAGASLSPRGEGPHELPQNRSLALVSILQRLAAAEIADTLHLRDFWSSAIFEFFNTIRAKRSSSAQSMPLAPAQRLTAEGRSVGVIALVVAY
jgi:hypothetical protein